MNELPDFLGFGEAGLPFAVIPPAVAAAPGDLDGELAARRQSLLSLETEAEGFGRSTLAAAFRRMRLLTEVWECVRADDAAAAARIETVVTSAFEQITGTDSEREAERAALSLIQDSNERWHDYLLLVDSEAADASPPDQAPSIEEPEPAIDAAALVRMLTGDASSRKPPAPRTAPRAEAAPPPAPPKPAAASERAAAPAAVSPPPPPPCDAAPPTPELDVPPPPESLTIDAELRETFLVEAAELFDRLESLILSLGIGARNTEPLNEIGRCLHTLKGASGSVGLNQLMALIHATEEHLEAADGEVSEGLIDLLHRILHYIEGVFIALRRGANAPFTPHRHAPEPAAYPPTAPAEAHRSAPAPPRAAAAVPPPPSHAAPRPGAPSRDEAPPPPPPPMMVPPPPPPLNDDAAPGEGPVRVSAERIDELMDLVSELIARRSLWAAQAETMKEFVTITRTSRNRLMSTIDRIRDLRPDRAHAPVVERPRGSLLNRGADLAELTRRLAEQSEDLVVMTETAQAVSKPLSENCDALERLTLQLWESLQEIRIVPVRGLFQRLARVAHDAARVEGRQVEVAMVGEETGLDRAVQDRAFEPLLHVVRNAVGHGIEPPEERKRAGKSPMGRVTFEARRSGNTLVLSVTDDGRGLDYNAITAKGRRLGLIGPDESPTLDRLNALIFQPGFSTREEANAISGRGVGMDVVSREVGRLHGTVALTSETGRGTSLTVSLPSRLALTQAMILRIEGQAFGLPVELIELAQSYEPGDVDRDGPYPRVRMREHMVPMIDAGEALGYASCGANSCPKLLLIRADGEPLAVLVDAIDGTCELVVKPMNGLLQGHPIVAGKSLSVSGEVVLTLNPSGLARWLREGRVRRSVTDVAAPPRKAEVILVVDDSISVRKVLARQLQGLGFEVEEVSDGLEALARLRRQSSYVMVVTDLEMPRMDGFELLAELSRLGIAQAIPVLIASSKADAETRRRSIELGACAFMPKPIEPELLAELVHKRIGDRSRGAGQPVASLSTDA